MWMIYTEKKKHWKLACRSKASRCTHAHQHPPWRLNDVAYHYLSNRSSRAACCVLSLRFHLYRLLHSEYYLHPQPPSHFCYSKNHEKRKSKARWINTGTFKSAKHKYWPYANKTRLPAKATKALNWDANLLLLHIENSRRPVKGRVLRRRTRQTQINIWMSTQRIQHAASAFYQ
jgi:hypothetical protein